MQRLGRAAISLLWGLLFLVLCARMAEKAGLAGSHQPVVQIVAAAPLAGGGVSFSYILYDPEDRGGNQTLRYGLYCYPDKGLASARAIRLFAHRIVDQRDTTALAGVDLAQGRSAGDVQRYTWRFPGLGRHSRGPSPALSPGNYYLYLVADDGVNDPVFAVSESAIRVEPAPAVLASGAPEERLAYLP